LPNRILREGILESERIHKISPMAELFYRRLMSIADDYGRYACDVPVLLSRCFPRRPTWADESTIPLWVEECREAGLLLVYQVDGRKYLEIIDFRQQFRAKKSKWPAPAQHMTSICVADAQHMRSETETETVINIGAGAGFDCQALADVLWNLHPSPSDLGGVQMALSKEKYKSTIPLTFDDRITQSLISWAEYWKQANRHATGLRKWIEAGDYCKVPPRVPVNGKRSRGLTAEEIAAL